MLQLHVMLVMIKNLTSYFKFTDFLPVNVLMVSYRWHTVYSILQNRLAVV